MKTRVKDLIGLLVLVTLFFVGIVCYSGSLSGAELRSFIEEEINSYHKRNISQKVIPVYLFDEESGKLSVTHYYTSFDGKWLSKIDRRGVYIRICIALKLLPLSFKEIKEYEYTLKWRDKILAHIYTTRKELDKINEEQIYNEFERVLENYFDKYGWSSEKEDELEVKYYYKKMLSLIANKEINF